MMAGNTILTPYQKQIASLLASTHIVFLKKKDPTGLDFLNHIVEGVGVHGKLYQNMLVIMYPNIGFSTELVRQRFPNIKLHDNGTGYLDMDTVVAAASADIIIKNSPFQKGEFHVLANPLENLKNKIDKNAYENTGQQNPDYLFINKNPEWSRFFDLKTGKFNINKCNVHILSTFDDYEKLSYNIFCNQKILYSRMYPDSSLSKYMELLDNNKAKSTSWVIRYEQYKIYLSENINKYSEINPSLVFYEPKTYALLNHKVPKYIEGTMNTETFVDVAIAKKYFKWLLENSGDSVAANYAKFNPLGIGEKDSVSSTIRKGIISIIDNVLS